MRSLVIDGELVACDADGLPDFYRLHFHRHDRGLRVWAFDLLHHDGRDLRELPLFERKARLEKLILAANVGWLHPSESFDDGIELLKAADRMKLEGIVSKRREAAPFAYGCTFGPSGIGGGRPSFYAAKRISSVPGMFSSSEVEVLHPT